MTLHRYLIAGALLFACGVPSFAQEKLPDGTKVAKLDVRPTQIDLNGPFAYSQLIVTATLNNGETMDATRIATITTKPGLATQTNGLFRPVADGKDDIAVSLDGQSVKVPLNVTGFAGQKPVSFVTDVQPALSKLGCNAGTCHGAQAGKNGFKLSLRGYDSIYDFRALTDDLEGRRFNRAAPEKSLMLMKPAGAVPHQGGVVMQAGDPNYELIRRWIAQGVKLDLDAVRVASIEVFPKNPIVSRLLQKQQFAVLATYTDGRVRDVTAETFLDSSNTEVATADKTGLVTALRRGESTMLARYEGAYAASTVVVMGDRTGFTWEPRPVQNYIDELVDAKLQKVKVQASPLANDSEFIRRVYLDLTGLPPSAEEVRAFIDDKRDTKLKRDELIDKLVGSDAFVEHWTNKWADLLQVNSKFLGGGGAGAFRKWIRDRVAENTPYDKFAYDILTASGSNMANPPASYYKVLRTADAAMENTTQLFLAVRFNCNKCHDHPFEKWTQDQYYSLASFFAQVTRAEDPKYKGQRIGGTAVEGALPLVEVVTDAKAGEITHVRTNEVAKPKFPYTIAAQVPATELRRVQAAKWITSAENPYFAKSYVNRLWGYLLGVGIIEPLDDIRAGNPATNPALLDKLTEEFVKSKFDVRATIKSICKSRTYQLSIATNKWNKDDDINYSHAFARRLPAEVLFDTIHKATGSISRLPGLPAGARAAQLVDSNVELPGGFLDLLGKPVRESACECERTGGLNLGPILAMVNGPIVGEAVRDPGNRINKLTLTEKDDGKVVDEIYLSVLNRMPTAKERDNGIAAIRGAAGDHAKMLEEYKPKVAAFEAYQAMLSDKQKAWEAGLLNLKPTAWTTLDVTKAESKHGAPAAAKAGATLTINKDGSILASGPTDPIDIYTVTGSAKLDKPITAIRLEALADPSLPAKGPGRAENGNFVLNEFRVTHKPLDKPDAKETKVKLTSVGQIFQQDGFPAANAVDGNPATGWATSPHIGKDNAALFKFDKPANHTAGVAFTAVLDHRFGMNHIIGKFRLSVTTDPNPKLGSPLTPEQATLLEVAETQRTPEQKARLRAMYLAQDKEYQRLAAEAANAPPADPRVLGAQDLVWALINNPAFLFNH
ncbi:MAG: DUF1549 domain-containing protein [Planctomycetes bacterium]|nr:DUF1549 domain-containing protein [Planctomycetota bacterium]